MGDSWRYDSEVDAAYLEVQRIDPGAAVEQVVIARPPHGEVIVDFSSTGALLGIEVLGASVLLRAAT